MLRFQRGDDAAFDELYRLVRARVHRVALRLLGEPESAAEAAQEVLVKVYRARATWRPEARFLTWLYRVATHHCLNERARAWRRRESGVEVGTAGLSAPAAEGRDPASASEYGELAAAIQRALDALPPAQRAAVVLARWEGLSMEELAEALDLPGPGAAKTLLYRARGRLSLALAPHLAPEAP